jgi:adenosylhomocysteine nucleosidase
MNDLAFDDPCLVFPMHRESLYFRREFRPQQRFPGAPCWVRFCGPSWLTVLLVESGIGAAATERALEWLLGAPLLGKVPYRPKVVINAGFAGALNEDLHVGDLVLATEVVTSDGQSWPTTWPGDLPPGAWQPPVRRGRLVTVTELVLGPQKLELGKKHQALAAEMEGAKVARMCAQRGVPFGCVRAISDDVNARISPRLASLLMGKGPFIFRLLPAVVAQPRVVVELARLARDTRRAARQLGKALGELLTLTLPFSV